MMFGVPSPLGDAVELQPVRLPLPAVALPDVLGWFAPPDPGTPAAPGALRPEVPPVPGTPGLVGDALGWPGMPGVVGVTGPVVVLEPARDGPEIPPVPVVPVPALVPPAAPPLAPPLAPPDEPPLCASAAAALKLSASAPTITGFVGRTFMMRSVQSLVCKGPTAERSLRSGQSRAAQSGLIPAFSATLRQRLISLARCAAVSPELRKLGTMPWRS